MLALMRSFVLVQHVKTRDFGHAPDFRLAALSRTRHTSAGGT
jgi:hypothetical protein